MYLRLFVLLISMNIAFVQATESDAPDITKYQQDWTSPEALVDALYETISADAGQQRDWDRFRALFFNGAQFLTSLESKRFSGILSASVEEMITQTESGYGRSGFHEIELGKRVDVHGNLASIWSTYYVKMKSTDEKPLLSGLNHFQLAFDGDRWWIISNTSIIDTKSYSASTSLD